MRGSAETAVIRKALEKYSRHIKPLSSWIFIQAVLVILIISSSGFLNTIITSYELNVYGMNDGQGPDNENKGTRASTLGIDIGPNRTSYGRFGDVISYPVTITNNGTVSDYIDITVQSNPGKWAVSVFMADEVTLLRDSPADSDGIPDTGLMAPTDSIGIVVKVTVPHTQAFNVPEITIVTASSSLSPQPYTGMCKLVTKSFPHLDATKSVSKVQIYEEEGAQYGLNTKTRVTLNVKGGGIPTMVARYHDVVFLIDNTGSMSGNDPNKVRLDAANSYVTNMSEPDQGAVVTFYGTPAFPRGFAWLARGPNSAVEHLTNNYNRLKANINWTGNIITGGTNILKAMQLGVNELIAFGNPSNVWYIILLTDGYDSGNVVSGDRDAAIRNEAQNAANNNIVMFTIGLGSTVNTQLLRDVANITKGQYYSAQNASQLMDIYNNIQLTVSKIAGRDVNLNDDVSMIKDVLPEYIHYVPDTFRLEPGSIDTEYMPSLIEHNPSNTTFHWNVEKILINQSWLVSFEVSSSKTGWVPVGNYPEGRIRYTDWGNDTEYFLAFPEVWIEVLPVPRPDVIPIDVAVNGKLYDPQSKIEVLRGGSVTISASVKNLGPLSTDQISPTFDLGFFNSTHPESPFFSASIGALSQNSISSEYTGEWTAPFTLAPFDLLVVADWNDVLPEGTVGEANNVFNLTINVVHVPVIDLIPINTKIDQAPLLPPPNNIVQLEVGHELKIELQVENQGNENTNYYTSLFQVLFYNRSNPDEPIGVQDIYSLSAGGSSRALVFLWEAPAEPGIIDLEIEVDSSNAVPEGTLGELNNKVAIKIKVVKDIFIDLTPGSLKINNDIKYIPEPWEITQTVYANHELMIGDLAEIEFEIFSIANEPSNYFASSFGITLFNATDPDGRYFQLTSIDNIEPDMVSDVYKSTWRAPLVPGNYIIVIYIDHNNIIDEGSSGENNNIMNIAISVFDVPAAPEPIIELDSYTDDSIIKWDSVDGAAEYQIFGGPLPGELNLTVPLTNTEESDWRHVSATRNYREFYYTVRAVDERGWAGPTGAIIGFHTKQFSKGYNTFSLPLEPFLTRSADWYADEILSLDHETIYYYDYDLGSWFGHPKFLPKYIDNFDLRMGESYMLYSTEDFNYIFCGRPETILWFTAGIPGQERLGAASKDEFYRNSLELTVKESGILLEWSTVGSDAGPENSVLYYEVYRLARRGGLSLTSAADPDVENSTMTYVATTRLTKYIDSEAAQYFNQRDPYDFEEGELEFSYIIVPVNELGLRGSSTYSKTISIYELRPGYNSFGLTLIGSAKSFVYDFITKVGQNDVDTVYYYDTSHQSWIGHPRFLPGFRDNPYMFMAEGYLIYLLADTKLLHYRIT